MTATLVGVDELIHSPRHRRYLLRHTFSGAALTPSDAGPSFTATGGTASVAGGVLKKTDATELQIVAATGVGANIVAQCKVNFGNSAGTDRRVSFRFRGDPGLAVGNFVTFLLYRTSASQQIIRTDAYSNTVIATATYALADSTDYWVRVVATGSRIELLISTDGTTFSSLAVVTEAAYQSQTAFAVRLIDNVASPTIQIDDLMVWAA